MENQQQPGQTVQPNAGSAADPSQTQEEITAIDSAVEQAPTQPASEPAPAQPEQADVNANPQQQPREPMPTNQEPAATQEQPQAPQSPPPQSAPESIPATTPEADDTQWSAGDSESPSEEGAQSEGSLLLSWQAAEPKQLDDHTKSMTLGILGLAVLIVAALFLFDGVNFGTILGTIVIVLGAIALILATRQHGHFQSYALYDTGVLIGNRFYAFNQLRSFSVIASNGAASIELEPVQRFMVRLVIHLENGTAEQAVDILSQNLPHQERSAGFMERFGNRS